MSTGSWQGRFDPGTAMETGSALLEPLDDITTSLLDLCGEPTGVERLIKVRLVRRRERD